MDIDLSINEKEVVTILKDFIKTYVQNAGCKNVVVGLSGGVDSAVVAVLCQDALGKDNIYCLFMPTESTSQDDIDHVTLLTKKFGLNCKRVDIDTAVTQIGTLCLEKPNRLTMANIKARVRMIILYAYANMTKSLVCGAANKSELLTGYFTKYGDGGADILPLGDLYKTQISALAKFLGIPNEVTAKPPTAGLWKGQTDEQELGMKYETLDKVLYGLEQKFDTKDIAKRVNAKSSDVERIRQMRKHSQHKRKTPLIPKIGTRTPGLDWRAPVQEG